MLKSKFKTECKKNLTFLKKTIVLLPDQTIHLPSSRLDLHS